MKLSRKQITVLLELSIVLCVTGTLFKLGCTAALAARGYQACGGEYLLLILPVLYYSGKQTVLDWAAELREVRKDNRS